MRKKVKHREVRLMPGRWQVRFKPGLAGMEACGLHYTATQGLPCMLKHCMPNQRDLTPTNLLCAGL
jgi:hypothetical protein